LLPNLSATTDRTRAGNHCYGSYTAMLGGVLKYNISRIVPRLPNSSAIYWGGQSILTHPYWP